MELRQSNATLEQQVAMQKEQLAKSDITIFHALMGKLRIVAWLDNWLGSSTGVKKFINKKMKLMSSNQFQYTLRV